MSIKVGYTTVQHGPRIDAKLTNNEYVLCDIVYYLCTNPTAPVKDWCSASKENLGSFIGLSKQTVLKLISKMEAAGFIEKNEDGRLLKTTVKWVTDVRENPKFTNGKESLPTVNQVTATGNESLPDRSRKFTESGKESLPYKYIDNDTYKNKDSRVDTSVSATSNSVHKKEQPKRKTFTKPTEEEVLAYMSERNYPISTEAAKFFNYYESKGWMVGRNSMKDWKASIRNWLSNINGYDINKKTPEPSSQPNRLTREEEAEQIRKFQNGEI